MRGIDELDHYELLEVGRGATPDEIDRAYSNAQHTYAEGSLALYSVFDRLDAEAIRQRLDEAYRVLSDSDLRARYDEELPISKVAGNGVAAQLGSGGGPTTGDGPSDRLSEERPDRLVGFDPIEQLDTVEGAVEEFDALEDDGRGEFDGVRLRRNRLFRGYEIDDISDVTKVSTSHLRNIEEENFCDLPADVYVRGFVTAYAQTIGLDPKIVVPSYMARVQESRNDPQRGRFLARR